MILNMTEKANAWSKYIKAEEIKVMTEDLEIKKKTYMNASISYAINSCSHVLCDPIGETNLKDCTIPQLWPEHQQQMVFLFLR